MTISNPTSHQIPDYHDALARYQNPAAQSLISTIKSGSTFEYDCWKATIEYGRHSDFQNILDFFVNLPSLQQIFPDEEKTAEWLWKPVQPNTMELKFYYRPELLQLLRQQGVTDTLIENGWLVREINGRFDIDTTWSDYTYLLQTNHHYLHIHLYLEIIH